MSDVPVVPPAELRIPLRWPALVVPQGATRFLVAGGLSSLVNWLMRFPLSAAMPFMGAVALAYTVGMLIGFWLYRSWVFPGSTLSLGTQAVRFVAVNALGLATVVVSAQLFILVLGLGDLLSIGHAEALAHGVAIVVGAGVNFVGHRALTFARRRPAAT